MEIKTPTASTLMPSHLRAKLAEMPELGCGNFLRLAERTNPFRNQPMFWFENHMHSMSGEIFEHFSLSELKRVSDQYAAWYYGAGVRERDPVAVFIADGIECLVHFAALTGLGAIPVLINGAMPPEIAALFLHKVGAVGLYTDESRLSRIGEHLLPHWGLRFVVTDRTALSAHRPEQPPRYPYEHRDDDPVLIGHSSGTTGIPKAVEFRHQQFFYGIRYRLSQPASPGSERLLSALPQPHSAGLAYAMLAVLNGSALMLLSEHYGESVLRHIEKFRATMVAAFPETYAGFTDLDFGRYDLSSVRLWVNGGDAAHEPHIRKLLSVGTRERDGKKMVGSVFIDGLGSSEMGFSLFRHVHTPDTDDYNRCIGTPLEWVDAAVLGENWEKLPPYQIGRLGVAGPSITPGYWNDTLLTWRSKRSGYFLTGDLFYYDDKGRFFHVDRVPDAIHGRDGMVYSLQTEELLLKHAPVLADVSVIAVPEERGEYQRPVAVARLRRGESREPEALLTELNRILSGARKPCLAAVVIAAPGEVPLGATGKVLKRELRLRYRHLFDRPAKATRPRASTRAVATV